MRRHAIFLRRLAILAVFVAIAGATLHLAGITFNQTASYPVGIWRLRAGTWQKGDIVLVDVPANHPAAAVALERGYVATRGWGLAPTPLVKRVIAVAGDHVLVTDHVRVNGRAIPNSGLLAFDQSGRPMMHHAVSGIVAHGDVWVLSDYSPQSYDSRYFGAIPAAGVRGSLQPLWTW